MNLLVALLQTLFIGLKLTGFIEWNWFWVLSPVICYCLGLGIVFVLGMAYLWRNRPKTPEQKAAAACQRMADAIRKHNPH